MKRTAGGGAAATAATDSAVVQKRFLLHETIKEATAAVSLGAFNCPPQSSSSAPPRGGKATEGPSSNSTRYISAAVRLQGLMEGAAQLKKLVGDFESLTLSTVVQDMQRMVTPDSAEGGVQPVIAARAEASHRLFSQECKLELSHDDYRLPENYTHSPQQGGPAVDQDAVAKALQPLAKLLESVAELRKCRQFNYEEVLQARREGEGMHGGSSSHHHVPLITRRLEEVVREAMERLQHSYARCRSGGPFVAHLAAWPGPFLRLLNEVLQSTSLEDVTDDEREKLRRIRFDVEELQHEQEQAVTDGDMHRSEELYFQKTALLETMKPHFDMLEGIMEKYKLEQGLKPREELRRFQTDFSATLKAAVSRETQMKRRALSDLEKLVEKKGVILKLREDQRASLAVYNTEWAKLYDDTVQQQAACFRAMEELERRVRQLAGEQALIVDDRLQKIAQERQREEDALTFYAFVESRQNALQLTSMSAEAAATSMQQVGGAVEFSCGHLDAYLRDCVVADAEEELLKARKERLEQFRGLYLTLGDLQFKKSRHAEEIEKKVEYYALQQEIAMDALNPKAKEYSQARQKWQAVHEEVKAQLGAIDQKCAVQIEDFKPTEKLLLQSGYEFKHPRDELEERNAVRAQKLLEYKQLMDSKVPKATSGSGGGAASSEVDRAVQEEADNNMLQLYSKKKTVNDSTAAVQSLQSVEGSPTLGDSTGRAALLRRGKK